MNATDLLLSPLYHWFPGNVYHQPTALQSSDDGAGWWILGLALFFGLVILFLVAANRSRPK